MDEDDKNVIESTRRWVDQVVVGFNFCPFAKREVQRQSIRYYVSQNTDNNNVLQDVMDELFLLDKNADIETTLILLPKGYENFEEYLDLVDLVEAIIDQAGYRGIFQLATFHPDYCFDGLKPEDPENYTNRAPYPTLHLIREESIARVLRVYADPDAIPVDNARKARELGTVFFQNLLSVIKNQPRN